jgi:hypothetical protein
VITDRCTSETSEVKVSDISFLTAVVLTLNRCRHNGVVIEPDEKEGEEGEASYSRSTSPPREASTSVTITSTAPVSKYYRAHTAVTTAPFAPPPTDGQQQYAAPIGHPTSSTRHWPPPPPWATETIQPVGQIPYQPMGGPPGAPVYYSPYYRTGPMITPTASPNDVHHHPPGNGLGTPLDGATSSVNASSSIQPDVATSGPDPDPIQGRKFSDPVIDPALEQQSKPTPLPLPPNQDSLSFAAQPSPPGIIDSTPISQNNAERQHSSPRAAPNLIAGLMKEVFHGESEEDLAQQYSTMEDAEGETDREDDESISIPQMNILPLQATAISRDQPMTTADIVP